jgi:beta-galactosidase
MTNSNFHFSNLRSFFEMTPPLLLSIILFACNNGNEKKADSSASFRERISINQGWRFFKYNSIEDADSLIYDVRPQNFDRNDVKDADAKPTEAVVVERRQKVLKPWVMPSGNAFIKDSSAHYKRPEGNPGGDFAFVQKDFDDSGWEIVNLPHDWAIEGPFMEGWEAEVGGGMGRLPSPGVAWYRKMLSIPASDEGRRIFLQVDGAMSYSIVWCNGQIVGGWPYGYNSWRLDLTPYVKPGEENQLAIRVDNPPHSSRWYPGGGIYRNVWLMKTAPVHIARWGTFASCRAVSDETATVDFDVVLKNQSSGESTVEVRTDFFLLDENDKINGDVVTGIDPVAITIQAGGEQRISRSAVIENPKLWGPQPTQKPNRYMAVTSVFQDGDKIDELDTKFGIRSLEFDGDSGLFVNGERIFIKGVNLHHDLGPLGAAFNKRAAERQLELLQEMGCNAVRMAHNPPAPEFLDLTDKMGFLVVNEIFDVWKRKKTPLDFHLIFPDWHEQDMRAFIRRDRNHPSVILWSMGNEVGEQYTGEEGAEVGHRLYDIIKEEDNTRPVTASMNYAKPHMPFPETMDVINLNYQGEGIRNTPAHEGLDGIRTPPLYPDFHEKFPDKLILSSENAATVSTRGEYIFPVQKGTSLPVQEGQGGNKETGYVSDYGIYAVEFGSSPDKVFKAKDQHPFVGGGFVWSGIDYLGEPTPYYLSRSSYFGIIDLAGFKKDRFYQYQSRWRPDLPVAHILPHWNWPERVGKVTPVHVFTSGDAAELFLNGKSLGRKTKGAYEYRLRWNDVVYEPGELKVVAYKNGEKWAEDVMKTTGEAAKIELSADRPEFRFDGDDLCFVTVRVTDNEGLTVPRAKQLIRFSIDGPGEIVATANGDQTNMVPFPSHKRQVFNGLALVIVRGLDDSKEPVRLKAEGEGLQSAVIEMRNSLQLNHKQRNHEHTNRHNGSADKGEAGTANHIKEADADRAECLAKT